MNARFTGWLALVGVLAGACGTLLGDDFKDYRAACGLSDATCAGGASGGSYAAGASSVSEAAGAPGVVELPGVADAGTGPVIDKDGAAGAGCSADAGCIVDKAGTGGTTGKPSGTGGAATGAAGASICDTSELRVDPSMVGVVDDASELSLGSTGPEVVALHDYFCHFGYFPSASLQRAYPAWGPLVASAPSEASKFDSSTEAATRAFQRNAGLYSTGVVDGSTWAALRRSRCGVPDGIVARDSSEEWNHSNTGAWNHGDLTWKLVNTDTNTPTRRAEIENIIATVLAQWDVRSGYTFNRTEGVADIEIAFVHPPTGSFWNAMTTPISGGGDVSMNIDLTWSTSSSAQENATDMASILIHELGHAVGLAHTPYSDAVMYPIFDAGHPPKTVLTTDDTTSILAINTAFSMFDGAISDIAYNRSANDQEQIWVTGGATTTGGLTILDARNKTSWFRHPGGALRIAVNPSTANALPWVVNDRNELFRYNSSLEGWDILSGACATDVGVGEDDSVWIVGCEDVVGGHDIRKLTASLDDSTPGELFCLGECFSTVAGGGLRIAVGPATVAMPGWPLPDIVPWVTTSTNEIRRRTTSNVNSGSFERLPGTATDIAAAGGIAWSIGTTAEYGGFNIQVWDEKGAAASDGSAPLGAGTSWLSVPGGGTNISVAAGRPVVVNRFGYAHWTEPN
jgi:matrixin/putative peptidoglycan binding protein